MIKKINWQVVMMVLGLGLIAVIVLRLMTPEDTWICSGGEWVMHGKPSSAQPTGECK